MQSLSVWQTGSSCALWRHSCSSLCHLNYKISLKTISLFWLLFFFFLIIPLAKMHLCFQACRGVLLSLCAWWLLPSLWQRRQVPSWGRCFTLENLELWKRWDKKSCSVTKYVLLWTRLTVWECFLLCKTTSNRNCFASTQTGANDLQTLADRLAQQSICASLSRRFPKVTIIGEEVCVFDAKQPIEEESESELMMWALFSALGPTSWGD